MRPIHQLAKLAVPAMMAAALTSGAAVATAEPVDDAYLARLRALGFTWPADHDAYMINLAHHICIDRLTGWAPDRIAHDVHDVLGHDGLQLGDVTNMVNAAEAAYCPNA